MCKKIMSSYKFILTCLIVCLFTCAGMAEETSTISETPELSIISETTTVGLSTETPAVNIPAETQTITQIPPQSLYIVKQGLSLMPTAYVRVSAKHPGETGFNSDFLFNFYIGEIYEYINKRNNFFVPYRIFIFGADTKYSFTIGQLLKGMGALYREQYATERLLNLIDCFDPGFYKQEQKYFPTIAVGMRAWLFTSMGTSFDLATAFEGAQWIPDYYIVASKKIGDFGFHLGYVYGNFVNNFFNEIKQANVLNQGKMGSWKVNDESNSHTLFVGFDMNIPWGTKKFTVESIFSSPDTFLINTSTGLWGFDLSFLKIPTGFTIIGYWSFRSNIFTFF